VKPDIRYVDMVGPMSGSRSSPFVSVPCHHKQVLSVACSGGPTCGQRPAHVPDEERARLDEDDEDGLTAPRPAWHGDWPWHVALYRNDQHACDGTLVGDSWVMTTSSCFQGQGRSKWVARFASVRLESRAPWEQRRRVVGMVKSPAEGHSVVLLRLERPAALSDFARPACLPSAGDEFIHMGAACVTLGWDETLGQLLVLPLEPAALDTCAEETEVAANSLCTRPKGQNDDEDINVCHVILQKLVLLNLNPNLKRHGIILHSEEIA
jgi:corin